MIASTASMNAPSRPRVWMSFALVTMLLASIFSTAIGLRSASAQEGQTDLASAVPADTVLYMSVNLDQGSPQWDLTHSLFERAGLNDLAETEAGASTEEIGDMAEASNINGSAAIVFTDADSLATYSSTDIAGTAMDTSMTMDADDLTEEVPEGFALIMQPEDPTALAEQFIGMTEDEATAGGGQVQTTEYSGVTITYWESDEPGVTGTATAEVDGTVVLATRASDVEPIIDAVQGNTENLASSDGFTSVTDKLPADNLVLGYMNLDVMITAMQNDPAFQDMSDQMLGVENLEDGKGHVGWVVFASDAGFHMDSVSIPNDPSTIASDSVFTPTMASKIPADLMLYSTSNNLYGTGISDILGTVMQAALSESGTGSATSTPAATPTVEETWAMFESQLGFNPDTDLLAKLDGEYATYVGVYDLESGIPTPEFLFVSGTSDAATLEQTSATITNLVNSMSQGDYEVSSREVEGGELTVITLDPETTGGVPLVFEFGVVNDEMLIGVNGAIDRYLDPAGPKLADDANYQKTFDLLPSENVINVSYVNIEGQVMPMLDWLSVMLMGSTSTLDNHEECATYATQNEAQTAYDADPGELWLLDMDFDGQACEDFFGDSTPTASPETISSQVNIPSAGSVTWVDDEAVYTSSILVIGD